MGHGAGGMGQGAGSKEQGARSKMAEIKKAWAKDSPPWRGRVGLFYWSSYFVSLFRILLAFDFIPAESISITLLTDNASSVESSGYIKESL